MRTLVTLAIAGCTSLFSCAAAHAQQGARPAAEHSDRYGDPLPEGAATRMGTLRLRHTSTLTGVAFSPDGRILASCGWDHPIRFWDAATGKPIKQLRGRTDRPTYGITFSPDGTQLASVGEASLVRLWDVVTGDEIWKTEKHDGHTYGVAFAPDGHTLASAGSDGTIRLWDVATGQELLVLGTTNRVQGSHPVAFSPNGSLLACGTSKDIQLYDLEAGGEPRVINHAHGGEIITLMFTPDGRNLVSGGRSAYQTKIDERGERVVFSSAEAKLWSVADGTLIREFTGKEPGPYGCSIALSQDGRLLASLHMAKIHLWNVSTGELLRTISQYHNSFGPRTHGIAISPDGKSVAAIGPRQTIMAWELDTGKRKLSFPESHESGVDCVACSTSGDLVASGARDGSVRLWDRKTGQLIRILQLGDKTPGGVHTLAFSRDGTRVAAGGYDWNDRGATGLVGVWKVSDGKSVWTKRVKGRVTTLSYSSDGDKLAAAAGLSDPFGSGQDVIISVWTADSGQDEQTWKGPKSSVNTMSFSADGTVLTLVEKSKTVSRWSTESRERLQEFPTAAHSRHSIQSAAFSPDGTMVVTSGLFDDLLAVWDAASGEEVRRIQVENSVGSVLAISPDGTRLASGSMGLTSTAEKRLDQAIHFWDMSTGEQVGRINPGNASVSSLAFSLDGSQLVSGMSDGTLLVWDVPVTVK